MLGNLESFEAPYLQEKLLKDGKFESGTEYNEAFREFKRYAALSQISTDNPLGMASKDVDEVWHQFILFTKSYHNFCNDLLGGYLHHSPHTSKTPTDAKKEGVKNFVSAYQQIFGEIPSIWNISSNNEDCGDSCNYCSGGADCASCDSTCN